MLQQLTGEKLLTGTEQEKLLPSDKSSSTKSAEAFLSLTPKKDLKNIFGGAQEINPVVQEKTSGIKPIPSFEIPKPIPQFTEEPTKIKTSFQFFKFLKMACGLAVLIFVALYIYGAILAL